MNSLVGPDLALAPGVCVPVATFELCAAPMSLIREDGLLVFVNAASLKIFGDAARGQSPVGMNLVDLTPREFFVERRAAIQKFIRDGKDGVIRDIWQGQQILTSVRVLPRQKPDEALRLCLLVHERVGGRTPPPDGETAFHDAEYQDLGPLALLSPRELEVLALVGEGMTAAQIAARLERSEETVNTHRASLLRKLGCQNAVQLGVLAYRAGLKFSDGTRFK